MKITVEQAREVARELLENSGNRWKHTCAVGAKAERIAPYLFCAEEAALYASAAWLHDIGYAASLIDTRYHPVDGARWIVGQGYDKRIANMVAHHQSYAAEFTALWCKAEDLNCFSFPPRLAMDAMIYADMTSGADGARNISIAERLADVERRYGPDHMNTIIMYNAAPEILGAEQRVVRVLGQRAISVVRSALTL